MRRLRTFVRYRQTVHELVLGETLLVGRAEHCDVVLDDELASREHCRLEIVGDHVLAVDLGSRNGILINGLTVSGRHEVHHGDIVTVGRSQLSVLRQEHEPRATGGAPLRVSRGRKTSSADLTGTGNVLHILAAATRTSLEDDDVAGAEGSGQNLFVAVRAHLSRHQPIRPVYVDETIDLGFVLAERSRDARWLDRVLDVHVIAKRLMESHDVDRFVDLADRIGPPERGLREYVEMARADASADPVALLRLETLAD